MEEIFKTTLLEYEKSAFLIDLVKHDTGSLYVRISQTIQDENAEHKRGLKINPSILTDLMKVLKSYHDLIPETKETKELNEGKFVGLTESEKNAIQSRYLKGISIADLALQFDCKKELIIQILNNNDIFIEENRTPSSAKKFHKKRR